MPSYRQPFALNSQSRLHCRFFGGLAASCDANLRAMKSSPSTREMQRAFLAGDASYDGVFVTGQVLYLDGGLTATQ